MVLDIHCRFLCHQEIELLNPILWISHLKIHAHMLFKSMWKIPLFGLLLVCDISQNTTSEFVENLQKTIKRFEETMKIQYSHPEDIRTGGFLDCKIY